MGSEKGNLMPLHERVQNIDRVQQRADNSKSRHRRIYQNHEPPLPQLGYPNSEISQEEKGDIWAGKPTRLFWAPIP